MLFCSVFNDDVVRIGVLVAVLVANALLVCFCFEGILLVICEGTSWCR